MGAVAAHGGMGVGCFFADETTVVSAGTDGSVTTLDVRNTSQPVTTSHAGAPVAGITRGSGCCEGHAVLACRDGTVRVWEPKQGEGAGEGHSAW